jgi:hypothetical protein
MSVTRKTNVRPGITSVKAFTVNTDTVLATVTGSPNIVQGTNDNTYYEVTFPTLDAGSYRLVYFKGSRVASVEESVYLSPTVSTTPLTPPATPGLCTVRVPVVDLQGNPLAGCNVSVSLEDTNPTIDSALVSRVTYSGTTGVAGYFDLVLIQLGSFTSGGVYLLKVSDPSGKLLHQRRVTVPNVTSCYVDDLPNA